MRDEGTPLTFAQDGAGPVQAVIDPTATGAFSQGVAADVLSSKRFLTAHASPKIDPS